MFCLCGMSLLNKRRPRISAASETRKLNKRRGAYSSKYGIIEAMGGQLLRQ